MAQEGRGDETKILVVDVVKPLGDGGDRFGRKGDLCASDRFDVKLDCLVEEMLAVFGEHKGDGFSCGWTVFFEYGGSRSHRIFCQAVQV